MTDEKAIEVIKSECYISDLMNLDRTTMVNTALDKAVEALQSSVDTQELIKKFRELQNDAVKRGYTSTGGFCNGVSACLRILLNEYEVPESPGDYERRGCCS